MQLRGCLVVSVGVWREIVLSMWVGGGQAGAQRTDKSWI